MDTNRIGARSEAALLSALLAEGHVVLQPFGVQPYDLVFDDGHGFHPVQVRTGRVLGGAMIFDTGTRVGASRRTRKIPHACIEYYGVYLPPTGESFLIPISECSSAKPTFRITPPMNGQVTGVRWAREYLIGM
jgi:hypothetical protein